MTEAPAPIINPRLSRIDIMIILLPLSKILVSWAWAVFSYMPQSMIGSELHHVEVSAFVMFLHPYIQGFYFESICKDSFPGTYMIFLFHSSECAGNEQDVPYRTNKDILLLGKFPL